MHNLRNIRNYVPDLGFKFIQYNRLKLNEVFEIVTDFVAAGSFANLRENVKYYNSANYAQLIRTTDLKNGIDLNPIYVDKKAFNFLWRVNLDSQGIILPNIGANIGEIYYFNKSSFKYKNNVLGPNAILLKSNSNNIYYLFSYMQSNCFQNRLKSLVGASGQPKFNKTELKSVIMNIPSYEIQEKISKLFKSLDSRISTQKKIINSKRSLIKSISQHFFMNAIPNVELKNIVTINKGKQVNGNLLNDTFTYSFFNGGSEASGKYNDYNAENFISISEGGNSCGYVNYVKGKFWSGGHNYTLTPTKEINLEYLYTFLKYKEQELMSLRVGTGLPNIQKSSLYKFKIYMPDYNIQNKIALIFTKLRESIENEEKNLKLYQKQKDYLLNKMFI